MREAVSGKGVIIISMTKPRILLICTGNSCRSQMAEGLVCERLGYSMEVSSAGTHPAGVNPHARYVLEEIGIDASDLSSKHVFDVEHIQFDLAVTLCDCASEICSHIPNANDRVHIPFEDPIFAVGTTEEVRAEFRRIRDEIDRRLIPYLLRYFKIEEQSERKPG